MLIRLVPSLAHWGAVCLLWLTAAVLPLHALAQPQTLEGPVVEEVQGDIEPDALVRVRVSGLREWVDGGRRSAWRLVPHVDGRPIAGAYPSGVSLRDGWLQFHLRITPSNEDAWIDVLSPPTFERFVAFSVGLEQDDAFASRYAPGADRLVRVIVIRWGWAASAIVLVLACTLGFAYLALRTRLLFEPLTAQAQGERRRLSLAKVQFALWFFVIFAAFLLIWLITGRLDSLNSSVVATLGISSGTALGESLLRDANGPTGRSKRASSEVIAEEAPPIGVLLKDLACDANGASIYRFQILAWTAVLLLTFVSQVYFDLTMPVFSSELLYLLGLSSGTYVAQGAPSARKWDPPPVPVTTKPPDNQAVTAAPLSSTSGAPNTATETASRLALLAQRMRPGDGARPETPS